MIKRIIFRADGNSIIGYGHFYRLLALIEMLKDDFQCVFAINQAGEILRNRILESCHSIIELDNAYLYKIPGKVTTIAEMHFDLSEYVKTGDIVVLDGYHFGQKYQDALRKRGCILVVVDDFLTDYPFADVVINHAPGLMKHTYPGNVISCFGLEYSVLRKDFFVPFPNKAAQKNQEIFVSLGAAVNHKVTLNICTGLLESNSFSKIHLLCTRQYDPHQLAQIELLQNNGLLSLYYDLDSREIVLLMDRSSFAFVTASTVLVESYARGLLCYTGMSVENQKLMYDGFINEHLAVGVGNINELTVASTVKLINTPYRQIIKQAGKPLQSIENFRKVFNYIGYGQA